MLPAYGTPASSLTTPRHRLQLLVRRGCGGGPSLPITSHASQPTCCSFALLHGAALYHTTLRLRQNASNPSSTSSSALASANTRAHAAPSAVKASGAATAPDTTSTTTSPSVVTFYDTFVLSQEDVHLLLLTEAHRKHGVWMNVPPQLAPTVPNVGPPTIPEPLYPAVQQARLDALASAAAAAQESLSFGMSASRDPSGIKGVLHDERCLAYAPTHDPPPFVTTGTRTLWVGRDGTQNVGSSPSSTTSTTTGEGSTISGSNSSATSQGEAGGAAGHTATATAAVTGEVCLGTTADGRVGEKSVKTGVVVDTAELQTTITEVAVRAEVDPTMQYHCSYCGRGFRRVEAAREHVHRRHDAASSDPAEAKATVLSGAGPGEIIGYKNVVETAISANATATTTTVTAPQADSVNSSATKRVEKTESSGSATDAICEQRADQQAGGSTTTSPASAATTSGISDATSPSASATTTPTVTFRELIHKSNETTTTTTTTTTAAATAQAQKGAFAAASADSAFSAAQRAAEGTTAPAPSSSATPPHTPRLVQAYKSVPTVTLPGEELIDELLLSIWDAVALTRDDIEKAAGVQQQPLKAASRGSATPATAAVSVDSCNGRFFIPSSVFVQGKADIRAELEAEAAVRPAARATPLGAAPGVRRPMTTTSTTPAFSSSSSSNNNNNGSSGNLGERSTPLSGAAAAVARRLQAVVRNPDGTVSFGGASGGDVAGSPQQGSFHSSGGGTAGGGLVMAPTARELSIAELSRHYPNPFGDSPNAALVEQEKEPVNPFRDLENAISGRGVEGEEKQEDGGGDKATGSAATMTASSAAAGAAATTQQHGMGKAKSNPLRSGGAQAATTPKGSEGKAEKSEAAQEEENAQLRKEWLLRFAARPYACPLCQRSALSPPSTSHQPAPSANSSTTTRGAAHRTASAISSSADPLRVSTDTLPAARQAAARAAKLESSPLSSSSSSSSSADAGGDGVKAWAWYAAAVPRFRLLDALEDHLEACHRPVDAASDLLPPVDTAAEGRGEVDWHRLYQIASAPVEFAEAELELAQRGYRQLQAAAAAKADREASGKGLSDSDDDDASAVRGVAAAATRSGNVDSGDAARTGTVVPGAQTGLRGGDTDVQGTQSSKDKKNNSSSSSSSHARSGGAESGEGVSDEESRKEEVAGAEAPHVHVRSAVNTVLVGVVRDVQEGFVGATRVLQYVLAVNNNNNASNVNQKTSKPISAHVANVTPSEKAEEAAVVAATEDEELIVVRCLGDLVPAALLHQQVHLGSTLFVAGTLRLNRNVDVASRRSHAYPYVQVVPPLGSVRVMK